MDQSIVADVERMSLDPENTRVRESLRVDIPQSDSRQLDTEPRPIARQSSQLIQSIQPMQPMQPIQQPQPESPKHFRLLNEHPQFYCDLTESFRLDVHQQPFQFNQLNQPAQSVQPAQSAQLLPLSLPLPQIPVPQSTQPPTQAPRVYESMRRVRQRAEYLGEPICQVSIEHKNEEKEKEPVVRGEVDSTIHRFYAFLLQPHGSVDERAAAVEDSADDADESAGNDDRVRSSNLPQSDQTTFKMPCPPTPHGKRKYAYSYTDNTWDAYEYGDEPEYDSP